MERLYILVDEKLSKGQKMSQACHATAEHMLKCGTWNNDTIVILDAPKLMIDEAIRHGATGYHDTYFEYPRACSFTELPKLQSEIKLLKLAS
jgi:hypothetical protein